MAAELGDLPLALAQAAAYIDERRMPFTDYLRLFREKRRHLWEKERGPNEYKQGPKDARLTVAATLAVSIEQVQKDSSAAVDLLNLCAFLAPENIPLWLVNQGANHLPERLSKAVRDELEIRELLALLRRYSLIELKDETISLHRLVQTVCRDRLEDERQWTEAATRLISDAFPSEVFYAPKTWLRCSQLLHHAMTSARHAERLSLMPEDVGLLLNQLGLYHVTRAQHAEAKAAYERSIRILEASFGSEHRLLGIENRRGDLYAEPSRSGDQSEQPRDPPPRVG